MKFDFCIGNPPYQGDNHQQLYPDFYLAAQDIAGCIEMIFPTGWQQPKNANNLAKLNTKEVKEDRQIVLINNVQNVFPNVSGAEWTNVIIWKKGYDNHLNGQQLVYTNGQVPEKKKLVWDKSDLSSIVPYPIILNINDKVIALNEKSIDNIIESQTKFNLDNLYKEHPEFKSIIGSNGKDKRVRNDAFNKISLFTNVPMKSDDVKIFGLFNRQRTVRYIHRRYLDVTPKSFMQYRVLLPEAAGVGFGCKLSRSIIIEPNQGLTQTFISFGGFDKKQDAVNCAKYIKTKFVRALLSILKITRRNNKDVWKYVPLQDFTDKSDIDWSKSVHEIDLQLYKKYGLDEKEIAFIEEKVKAMD